LSGLAGEMRIVDFHIVDFPEEIEKLQTRSVTPGAFFLQACDGKFTDEDLNEEGNAFAEDYFDFDRGQYLADYQATLGADLPDLYYVKDSWDNFDRLRPVLDRRFAEWKTKRR
jgi:hypothetical protein